MPRSLRMIFASVLVALVAATGVVVSPAPAAAGYPVGVTVTYNRAAAASWAYRHVTDEQPREWAGCTWFVSRALWAGGYHQTPEWNGNGYKGRLRKTPGTLAATAAPNLVDYLTRTGRAQSVPLTSSDFRNNALPQARVGDVIAYDWMGDGIDHLAIIVRIAPGHYPEVAEWGTVEWNSPSMKVTYRLRGWTWSEKSRTWIQSVSPSVKGILLRMAPAL